MREHIIKNKKYTFITDIVKKHPSLEITPDMNEANIDLVPSIPVKTINWFLRNTDFENENLYTRIFTNKYHTRCRILLIKIGINFLHLV